MALAFYDSCPGASSTPTSSVLCLESDIDPSSLQVKNGSPQQPIKELGSWYQNLMGGGHSLKYLVVMFSYPSPIKHLDQYLIMSKREVNRICKK